MPSSRRITFAVLTVAVCAFVMLQSLVVPVLGEFETHFGTDQSTTAWVLTAYLLSAAICTPLLGRLGDLHGKTRVLGIALATLSLGCVLAALAPSIEWLIAARVLQGIGGGVLPLSFGIIRDEFGDRMGTPISVIASLTGVGFGAGIVLAGPIVSTLGHTWLFWIPAVTTAIAAVAAVLLIPPSPVRSTGTLPWFPAILLSLWLVALLLGLSQGNEHGWLSARILALLIGAVLLAVAWVVVETRVEVPLIDMRMMRQRGVWTANVVALFVGFGMFASFAFLPQFLQTPTSAGYGMGASFSESGRILLPSAVATFLVGFVTAPLVRRLGARVVIAGGALLNTSAFVSIAVWHEQAWQLYLACAVQGAGAGVVFSALAGVVVASVPAEQTGAASGMNANIRSIGGSIGTATLAGIVTARIGADGLPLEANYVIGFIVLGGALLLAAGAALMIPDRRVLGGSALTDAANAELALVPGSVPGPAQR